MAGEESAEWRIDLTRGCTTCGETGRKDGKRCPECDGRRQFGRRLTLAEFRDLLLTETKKST